MASSSYVTLECELCGQEYERHKSQREESKYCSTSCKNGIEERAGPDELVPRYSDKWHENRQKTLEKANYQCESCGVEIGRKREKGKADAEVHHIKPWAAGGTHELSNLKALCADCHRREDQ